MRTKILMKMTRMMNLRRKKPWKTAMVNRYGLLSRTQPCVTDSAMDCPFQGTMALNRSIDVSTDHVESSGLLYGVTL